MTIDEAIQIVSEVRLDNSGLLNPGSSSLMKAARILLDDHARLRMEYYHGLLNRIEELTGEAQDDEALDQENDRLREELASKAEVLCATERMHDKVCRERDLHRRFVEGLDTQDAPRAIADAIARLKQGKEPWDD